MPTLIRACFTLHNFCEMKNSYIDDEELHIQMENNKVEEVSFKNIPDPIYSSTNSDGVIVRNILKDFISNCM